MNLVDTLISASELKARWVYGELFSSRWLSKRYPNPDDELLQLIKKAKNGLKFESLSDSNRNFLCAQFCRQSSLFEHEMGRFKEFVLQCWSKDELLSSFTIPAMSPEKDKSISFSEFIGNPVHKVDGVEE